MNRREDIKDRRSRFISEYCVYALWTHSWDVSCTFPPPPGQVDQIDSYFAAQQQPRETGAQRHVKCLSDDGRKARKTFAIEYQYIEWWPLILVILFWAAVQEQQHKTGPLSAVDGYIVPTKTTAIVKGPATSFRYHNRYLQTSCVRSFVLGQIDTFRISIFLVSGQQLQ